MRRLVRHDMRTGPELTSGEPLPDGGLVDVVVVVGKAGELVNVVVVGLVLDFHPEISSKARTFCEL